MFQQKDQILVNSPPSEWLGQNRPSRPALGFSLLLGLSVLLWLVLVGALILGQPQLFLGLTLVIVVWETFFITAIFTVAWRDLNKRVVSSPAHVRPTIAVLIPAWNEASVICQTLASLLGQSEQPERIIVADDGSRDGTVAKLIDNYGVELRTGQNLGRSHTHPHLYVLAKGHSGKADSLNQAIALAQEEIILVLDADTRLYPGVITSVRNSFAQTPQLHAVAGVPVPTCSSNWRGRIFQFFQRYEYMRGFVWYLGWNHFQALTIISGACSAFRRQLLVDVGGYDPNSWTEDCEIIFRLQAYLHSQGQGLLVRVEPGFLAQTEAPEQLLSFLRQRRRWFGGFLETLVQYRDLVGDRRYRVLGLGYLAHATLAIMSPFFILAGSLGAAIFYVQGYIFPDAFKFTALGFWLFNLGISWGRLNLYQSQVGRRWLSFPYLVLDTLLAPLIYTPLMMVAQIWGYFSYCKRQKSW